MALIEASYCGHFNIVKLLLERGAKVNKQNGSGETALMWASLGHHDVVKLLLERGAKVNKQDKEGKTALMHVRNYYRSHTTTPERNNYQVIINLLEQKKKISIPTNMNR